MRNKILRLGTSVISVTVIGLAGCQAITQRQSPTPAVNFKESEELETVEQTQEKESNLPLAQNSEEQTRIQVYEQASPAVVAIATGTGHGSGFIVSADGLVMTSNRF